MGTYFRTIEMGRYVRFACYRCGPAVTMRERLIARTCLELACDGCEAMLLVVATDPIPPAPAVRLGVQPPNGFIRYRTGQPLDHGSGFRCHSCGRKLIPEGKPATGAKLMCPRCHAWHHIGSLTAPPQIPRVGAAGPAPASVAP